MDAIVITHNCIREGKMLKPGREFNIPKDMSEADAQRLMDIGVARDRDIVVEEPVEEPTPEKIEELRQKALLEILEGTAEDIEVALTGLDEADLNILSEAEEAGENREDVLETIGAAVNVFSMAKILNGYIPEIEAAISKRDLNEGELFHLIEVEEAGENRKGVIDVLNAAIKALGDSE